VNYCRPSERVYIKINIYSSIIQLCGGWQSPGSPPTSSLRHRSSRNFITTRHIYPYLWVCGGEHAPPFILPVAAGAQLEGLFPSSFTIFMANISRTDHRLYRLPKSFRSSIDHSIAYKSLYYITKGKRKSITCARSERCKFPQYVWEDNFLRWLESTGLIYCSGKYWR